MTLGQIEDKIAKELTTFYAKTLGVGPRNTRVYLMHDMVLIRLMAHTHAYEHILLKKNKGVEIVKHIRTTLLESVVEDVEEIVQKYTGANVQSVHFDSSTRTGERFLICILDRNLG